MHYVPCRKVRVFSSYSHFIMFMNLLLLLTLCGYFILFHENVAVIFVIKHDNNPLHQNFQLSKTLGYSNVVLQHSAIHFTSQVSHAKYSIMAEVGLNF